MRLQIGSLTLSTEKKHSMETVEAPPPYEPVQPEKSKSSEPAKREKPAKQSKSTKVRGPPPSTPDKFPPNPAFSGETVEIKVGTGDTAETFYVQEDAICFYSGWFSSALEEGRFVEGEAKIITLANDRPVIFRRVEYWITNRTFQERFKTADPLTIKWWELAELWLFGGRYEMPLLQNEVINCAHGKAIEEWVVPSLGELGYIYKNTEQGSPLRRYWVMYSAKVSGADQLLKPLHENKWPREALVDVLRITWGTGYKTDSKKEVLEWDLCEFHVHEKGVECADRKRKTSDG